MSTELDVMREESERLRREVDFLQALLEDIGAFAHERSKGPTVQDDLWEVRRMAYQL